MKRTSRFAPLFLALGLAACLENEEEIVIHEDGSVDVRIAAKGDLRDLSNGYPVPLGSGGELRTEDARTWVSLIGSDTGSAAVQARVDEVEWPNPDAARNGDVRLEVGLRFDSVYDLPQFYAPVAEPYRTAFLRRSTTLDVRAPSGRKVYVFERVFHRRSSSRQGALERAFEELPENLQGKLEREESLRPDEWRTVEELVRDSFQNVAEAFARDAILGLYTKGDASLPPKVIPSILEDVRRAAVRLVTVERLSSIYIRFQTATNEEEEEEGSRMVRDLEESLHQSIRDSLRRGLSREGVAENTQNAILFGLEWGFTAYAHTDDIGDEGFKVRVKLPGTLISGNHDSEAEGYAVWEFKGETLHEGDVVLRAVSVLE